MNETDRRAYTTANVKSTIQSARIFRSITFNTKTIKSWNCFLKQISVRTVPKQLENSLSISTRQYLSASSIITSQRPRAYKFRRPEGSPGGAPYPYKKEKETHKLIFSWLSWLAVLLVGAYPRRRRPWSRATRRPYSS